MSGEEFTALPIHEAIARAKAECSPVGKDGYNPDQNFKFRGVDAVVNGAAKALNRYGVIITTKIKLKKIEQRTYQSRRGANMLHVLVPVRFELYGADGSGPVVEKVVGEAADSGDKVISKATSVAYRIMLLQLLNLPTGDPDPDSEAHERAQAGGEDWRNLPPVSKPQKQNGNRQAATASADPFAADEWAERALQRALALKDSTAARALWHEVTNAAKEGGISEKQRDELHEIITAQVEDLARQQAPAVGTATAPEGDPWLAKIEEITSEDDAASVREELDAAHSGGLVDSRRHKALGVAIRTRLNGLKVPS